MEKVISICGPVFTVLTARSSNRAQPTLRLYSYKHHLEYEPDGEPKFIFDLDDRDQLIEDFQNPVAKIDWHDGSVKVLDKTTWSALPITVQDYVKQDFYRFWQRYNQ